ncbi:MAG: AAA family ATPase, partial [Cyclobacteriaceae bacterium]|nr:AAA family ATPase [Cyclobacteriaceae bacterium]
MIKSLLIKNYALIQHLKMDPSPHFNTVTGETGAGKSIMLGALGLLLGNRADTRVLFEENQKCVIEGSFEISKLNMIDLFD